MTDTKNEVNERFQNAVDYVYKYKDVETFYVAVQTAARDFGIDYQKLLHYFDD